MSGVEYAMQKYNAWAIRIYSDAVETQPTFYVMNESAVL